MKRFKFKSMNYRKAELETEIDKVNEKIEIKILEMDAKKQVIINSSLSLKENLSKIKILI